MLLFVLSVCLVSCKCLVLFELCSLIVNFYVSFTLCFAEYRTVIMFGFGVESSSSTVATISPLFKDDSASSPFSGLVALKNGTEMSSGQKEATIVNSDLNVLRFITQDVERSLGVWLILVMLILFLCSRFVGNVHI